VKKLQTTFSAISIEQISMSDAFCTHFFLRKKASLFAFGQKEDSKMHIVNYQIYDTMKNFRRNFSAVEIYRISTTKTKFRKILSAIGNPIGFMIQ